MSQYFVDLGATGSIAPAPGTWGVGTGSGLPGQVTGSGAVSYGTPVAPPAAKPAGASFWDKLVGAVSSVGQNYAAQNAGYGYGTPGAPYGYPMQQPNTILGLPSWVVLGGAVVGAVVLLRRKRK